jgi:hypothetical protein
MKSFVFAVLCACMITACKPPMKGDMCGTVASVVKTTDAGIRIRFADGTRPYTFYFADKKQLVTKRIDFKVGDTYVMSTSAYPGRPIIILGAKRTKTCSVVRT